MERKCVLRFFRLLFVILCCVGREQQVWALDRPTCQLSNAKTEFIVVEHCKFVFQFNCSGTSPLNGFCYKDSNDSRVVLPEKRFPVGISSPQGLFTVTASPSREDDGEIYCTANGYQPARLVLIYVASPQSTIELRSVGEKKLEFTCKLTGQRLSGQSREWELNLLRNGQQAGRPSSPLYQNGDDMLGQEFLTDHRPYSNNVYTCRARTTVPVALPCIGFHDSLNSIKIPQFPISTSPHSTPTELSITTESLTPTGSSIPIVPSTTLAFFTVQTTTKSTSHHDSNKQTTLIAIASTASGILIVALIVIIVRILFYIRKLRQMQREGRQKYRLQSGSEGNLGRGQDGSQSHNSHCNINTVSEISVHRSVQETQQTFEPTEVTNNRSDKHDMAINPATSTQPAENKDVESGEETAF